MESVDEVLAGALALPVDARARVAQELIRSLDGGIEEAEKAEEAWTVETARRLREVEDGSVELMSSDEVKRRMAARRASLTRVG